MIRNKEMMKLLNPKNEPILEFVDNEDWGKKAIDLCPEVFYNHGNHFSGLIEDIMKGSVENLSGKTRYFTGSDSEVRWKQFVKEGLVKNEDRSNIRYHYNKQAFRYHGDKSDTGSYDYHSETGGVMFLGCSHTFGTGINLEDTWSYKIMKTYPKFKGKRYINMGLGGHGIMTYYRLLRSSISIIKPDYVVLTYPWFRTRSERWNDKTNRFVIEGLYRGSPEKNIPATNLHLDDETIVNLFSDEPSILRYLTHKDAINWICHVHNVPLYFVSQNVDRFDPDNPWTPTNEDQKDKAFDFLHVGPKWHDYLVEHYTKIFDNYEYYKDI